MVNETASVSRLKAKDGGRQHSAGKMAIAIEQPLGLYRGLRMTAEEYLALGETPERYELIDGVVCISPSPSFDHQRIITEIAAQIRLFLKRNSIGEVAVEVDVRLRDDLVYRPDIVFLTADKAARCGVHVTEIPDVVVEVLSPDSSRMDRETKKRDYERCGVREYWLVDPVSRSFTFFRARQNRFEQVAPSGELFSSQVVDGFSLDLAEIRWLMR